MSEVATTLSPPANTLPAVPPSGGGLVGAIAPTSEIVAFIGIIERAARDPSIDIDKLDRLLQMRERENARVAEQTFNTAMSLAQAEMQPIGTDSDNPQTRSRYASYATLDRAVRPIYTNHGFGLSFNTDEAPGPEQARIVCDVCHVSGHTRRYHVDMPVDGKGARGGDVMTKTHALGSGISYGMRYLLRMIFNLAIDQDDDGNAAGGHAKTERPRTVVPAPKHALKSGGIAERAITTRYAEAVRSAGPSQAFRASEAGTSSPRFRAQAGGYNERNPPPDDVVPDGAYEASRALNKRLHDMHDELPGDLGPPNASSRPQQPAKVDGDTGIPDFLDRRRKATTGASYLDLVGVSADDQETPR